jgi:lipopolysaccharide export system protein LptA
MKTIRVMTVLGIALAMGGSLPRGESAAPPPSRTAGVDDKLRQVFGANAPELSRSIKLALGNGLVLAVDRLAINPAGAADVSPVSIALARKGQKGQPFTLMARRGLVEWDRPVSSIADFGARKLVRVTLIDSVVLVAGPGRELRADRVSTTWDFAKGAVSVEAKGNVVVRTPELNIAGCESITLWFRVGAGAPKGKGDTRRRTETINLDARVIEARLAEWRPEVLRAVGKVHLRMGAAGKELEVNGDEMEMTGSPEGNVLVVRGDLGQLRKDKVLILGPEVYIDQASNKVWVHGPGAIQMESATNFQGASLKRPVPLTVHWNKGMFCNGDSIELRGGIQAEQGHVRLACECLQIILAPSMRLDPSKTIEAIAVSNLVCDRDVRFAERVVKGGRLVKYRSFQAASLVCTASGAGKGHEVHVSGPGSLRLWQRSGKEGLKLTYVAFGKRIDIDPSNNTIRLWEDVRVYSVPTDNPRLPIDLDTVLAAPLPEGAMYLRCDRLRHHKDGALEGHGRVWLQARELSARADSVYYNQAKNQIILDGRQSRQATLYRVIAVSEPSAVVQGKKIIYNRTTGTCAVEGGPREGTATPAPME